MSIYHPSPPSWISLDLELRNIGPTGPTDLHKQPLVSTFTRLEYPLWVKQWSTIPSHQHFYDAGIKLPFPVILPSKKCSKPPGILPKKRSFPKIVISLPYYHCFTLQQYGCFFLAINLYILVSRDFPASQRFCAPSSAPSAERRFVHHPADHHLTAQKSMSPWLLRGYL